MKPEVRTAARWAYDAQELGRAVRRVRHETEMTQSELADRLGVARMTVSRLENGEAVSIETAIRALSECGYAVAVAPKFARLVVQETPASQLTVTGTSVG